MFLFTVFFLAFLNITTAIIDGSYSDPNHPSCARVIQVESLRKLNVYGADAAGGEGVSCDGTTDVKWGPLPGYTAANRVVVDFSSKGGPSDLTGKYQTSPDGKEQIVWKDGNAWTKL